MQIKYHGATCFTVKGKALTMVINPEETSGKLKGDVVLSSLLKAPSAVDGSTKVFDWPGEYEVRGVPIVGYQAWTTGRSKETEDKKADSTIIFSFEVDGVKICHLGLLGHTLSSDMVKAIGDVDVLMVSVGADSNLDDKKTREIVEAIDPKVLIPMGDADTEKALKEMGIDDIQPMEEFEVKASTDLPADKRIYVALKKA